MVLLFPENKSQRLFQELILYIILNAIHLIFSKHSKERPTLQFSLGSLEGNKG